MTEDKIVKQSQVRKRQRGIITRNQILEVAAQMFACKGYDNVSVREIAKGVGVKESSLYNHFKNKQDILDVLLDEFSLRAPASRPSIEQLESMADLMSLKEILKNIMFSVGRNIDTILLNTAIIIQCERFRMSKAAEAYRKHIVEEPIQYYQNLIGILIRKNRIENRNALEIIKQYSYMANVASQEYFMAKNGLGDIDRAVGVMLETIEFYSNLMDKEAQLRIWR